MSDKPKFESCEVKNASPQQLREKMELYVQHVLSHDPNKLKFALMVTGHDEGNDSTHVCSVIGGPPETLAEVVMGLMDDLVNRDPAFAIFFLLSMLQRIRSSKDPNVEVEVVDLDATGGSDIEAQVKDLIDKLQNTTPPDGSIH